MSVFTYTAADRTGNVMEGEREAESEKSLAQILKAESLFLLEARERGKGLHGSISGRSIEEYVRRLRPVSLVEKMFFARNLGVMIAAGLPLTRALEALIKEVSHPEFKKILHEVNSSVIKGKSFAESLRVHQDVFGELFVNMVEVGETTGKLTLVLKLLANQMKRDHDLRKRVRGALIYPAIIVIALVGIGAVMMIFVVPTLTQVIEELGVELPFTTRIIIAVSKFISAYALSSVSGVLLAVVVGWRLVRTKRGREISGRVLLPLPIFGPLIKKFNVARFCRSLAYLISSGVPIVRSLEITSTVLGNSQYRAVLQYASAEIQKGRQLNAILEEYPTLFQSTVVQMVAVGEETGKLSSMMLRLAIFFEEDVSNTTKNLSTIIEPLLMVVIGATVGFFAVSMLQPIYGSLGNIGI